MATEYMELNAGCLFATKMRRNVCCLGSAYRMVGVFNFSFQANSRGNFIKKNE
jgi:hypothetical protein